MTILWIFGEQAPRSVSLDDDVITIGRTDGNTIRINDETISKRHAQLFKQGGRWWIEDLGSANGTWVREERISQSKRPLDAGTRFKMGRHEFRVDEPEISRPSWQDLEERGTIFTSMQAIPSDFLSNVASTPQSIRQPHLHANTQAALPRNEAANQPAFNGSDEIACNAGKRKETFDERKLRLIRSVGEAVIEMTELTAVAGEILRILVAEIDADRAFICLISDDGTTDAPLASHGVEPNERIVFSNAVRREMLENRSGVLITHVDHDDSVNASLAQLQVSSTICVPLWTKDRIMGFMSMDITNLSRSFTTADLELLIFVSHQAAIGLERARLSEIALQERKRRDYLSQYLDHKIIQSVLNSAGGEDPLAAREQIVTVMFCDIVSFTKMSEGLPPNELASFVHDHFTAMTAILFAHNGTVDKYIGDAVMALFGAPVADPLAPIFAVRAAIAMLSHAENIAKPPVRLRFGIATGPATVGNIGSAQRREYTAIGDTVNVASRLESFARPNEIIVDEATAKCLGNAYDLRSMGDIDVRNRMESVHLYQVEPKA